MMSKLYRLDGKWIEYFKTRSYCYLSNLLHHCLISYLSELHVLAIGMFKACLTPVLVQKENGRTQATIFHRELMFRTEARESPGPLSVYLSSLLDSGSEVQKFSDLFRLFFQFDEISFMDELNRKCFKILDN